MNQAVCVHVCAHARDVCECPFSLSPGKEKGLEEEAGRWPGRRRTASPVQGPCWARE